MPNRRLVTVLRSLALAVLLLAPSARGELVAWDQTRVSQIAKNLAKATDTLQKTFLRQPPPNSGPMQSESYYELKQLVWMLDVQAGLLVKSLEEGDGREQTLWVYEILMSVARSARYKAHSVSVAEDVGKRAAAVRGVLNELGPYYDPDFQTWPPDAKIEPASTP
jgi:hypothetical protein